MKVIQISAIWCSSCLVMKKVWDECKKIYKEIEWESLDIDFDSEASKYQVGEKLPVLIFEKEKRECSRLVGERKKEEVVAWLKQNIES